ncbi:hypothetical protein PQJ75_10120 [Rhodoplanes sp. TEM]|uniref:Uncharacterized protein n=2 Tax=Rhodoplanes TaxID=29407 RepID=A0ABT5J834_RHOTP|nr:hypothetical protein [Rhodoplanes tepidamans]MDC7785818.1 hypothetical protein [Rhodoplanes tepidamans]MDC7984085.1 hypothetical protein [Rhodoplanes sp. TEM]MDQ0354619.1 hypothetical protein [Rhodoplanes tepidamans]
MPLPPELRHAAVIRDEMEALSTLDRALSMSGCTVRDANLLRGLLLAKAAVIAVNRTTGEVVVGFHRIESPQRRRWFTLGDGGMNFVWESDGETAVPEPPLQ